MKLLRVPSIEDEGALGEILEQRIRAAEAEVLVGALREAMRAHAERTEALLAAARAGAARIVHLREEVTHAGYDGYSAAFRVDVAIIAVSESVAAARYSLARYHRTHARLAKLEAKLAAATVEGDQP